MTDTPLQGGIAVEGGEFAEHLSGARVDLPMPLGPANTTLLASLRKSSDISASMPARSQLLGQSQSKSHKGLKRPI